MVPVSTWYGTRYRYLEVVSTGTGISRAGADFFFWSRSRLIFFSDAAAD